MEELQEADVTWGSQHYHHHHRDRQPDSPENCFDNERRCERETEPVNIQPGRRIWGGEEEPAVEDDGQMVPPHVIVDRRAAGKMTFSMCTGHGRTLKGRDLSRLRNSVLRMTGFLEG